MQIQNLSPSDVFFQVHFQMHNPFSAEALPRASVVGELTTLPQIPIRLGTGHQELKYPYPSSLDAFGVSDRDTEGVKGGRAWVYLVSAPRFLGPTPTSKKSWIRLFC